MIVIPQEQGETKYDQGVNKKVNPISFSHRYPSSDSPQPSSAENPTRPKKKNEQQNKKRQGVLVLR